MASGLDVIGDVHGRIDALAAVLCRLGYRQFSSSWHHPDGRKAVFVGNYLDRGPQSFGVVQLVRQMCMSGDALAILGNHDSNAIAFSMRRRTNAAGAYECLSEPEVAHREAVRVLRGLADPSDHWLRNHAESSASASAQGAARFKNIWAHSGTLGSVTASQYAEMIAWLRCMPLWIELPHVRVVHAAWIPAAKTRLERWERDRGASIGIQATSVEDAIEQAVPRTSVGAYGPSTEAWAELLELPGRWSADQGRQGESAEALPDSHVAISLERLVKGVEIPLPAGAAFEDSGREPRHHIRAKWYDAAEGRPFHEHMLASDEKVQAVRRGVGELVIPPPTTPYFPYRHTDVYPENDPPVLFGHYQISRAGPDGSLQPLRPNVACVDVTGDAIFAYRFDGERHLSRSKFVSSDQVAHTWSPSKFDTSNARGDSL